jgi:predicted lipid-binding transport protein (Tim44 family)
MIGPKTKIAGALATALALSLMIAGPADARRGGSFGSRGMRTYSAPRSSYNSPGYTPPIQNSMTPRPAFTPQPSYAPSYGSQFGQRSRFGGFGGGFLGGLIGGGLIGGMLGHGFGGGWGGGLLTILIQLAVIGGLVWLAMRLFRRNSGGAPASGVIPGPWGAPTSSFGGLPGTSNFNSGGSSFGGFGGAAQTPPYAPQGPALEIPINQTDMDAFTRLLIEVQDAFGHEDYGRLRANTTPEVMGFLAEELSQNATHGRRNDVTGTRLISSDVAEAWREGDADYATVALRYESIDVMRDRNTNAVVEGDPAKPTATTELWTFVRHGGDPWKLSAIQETA